MSDKVDLAARLPVRREPLSVEEQGAGFHAVLAGATGRVLITNDIGRQVLDMCDGNRTEGVIVGELAAVHDDVPRERIAADVHHFLDSAMDKGAIAWTQ